MKKILVIGAGFSGAVIANQLADEGMHIDICDSRDHLGGNCHTYFDEDTGILVHKYGPHIFHTDNERVWNFINQFAEMMPYTNRVKTRYEGTVYSLPVNLHTINQFYNKSFSPAEAEEFVKSQAVDIPNPSNFEEQALAFIGSDLYEAFFKNYTQKQWGLDPKELPASILKRLPIRFDYNDNYFAHKYQGIPKMGYTDAIKKILDKRNINVILNQRMSANDCDGYDHIFYSGPLDAWYEYRFGDLGYRTLDFKEDKLLGSFQGTAVMNYPELSFEHTRITEHKYFAPWEKSNKTIIFTEYSRAAKRNDIPYYPIRFTNDKETLKQYIELAKKDFKITFVGRLGTYRYLDMDVTIKEALELSDAFLSGNIKRFSVNPL